MRRQRGPHGAAERAAGPDRGPTRLGRGSSHTDDEWPFDDGPYDGEPAFSEAVMELAACAGLPTRILTLHRAQPDGTCTTELHDGPVPYPCRLRSDAVRALMVQAKAAALFSPDGRVPLPDEPPTIYVPWI